MISSCTDYTQLTLNIDSALSLFIKMLGCEGWYVF